MKAGASFRWMDLVWFLLVLALAGVTRYWYLSECVDRAVAEQPPFLAQGPAAVGAPDGKGTNAEIQLIGNIRDNNWFGSRAPLSSREEDTAHVAPGYPWAVAMVERFAGNGDALALVRWGQCSLGALTAGFYFVFARMAFGNLAVAVLTGVLCAVHPFWIINTAEMQDGVLTSLLLGCCLVFGTRAGNSGDAFSSLLFGLSLAGLGLVRAATFPFAVVGLLWFLHRCRDLPRGWFFALLAVLGFVNGVAPWAVRNYQTFGEVIPVADSVWLHLWIGFNPGATGADMDNADMAVALATLDKADGITGSEPGRLEKLHQEPLQNKRYKMLAEDTVRFARENPVLTLKNRLRTGLYFFLGGAWFPGPAGSESDPGENVLPHAAAPALLQQNFQVIVNGTLLGMLLLALLGWRWTYPWRERTGLATLALIWIPLPYLFSHAENLWGPRLPLDGLLLCYAAFALVYLVPSLGRVLAAGPQEATPREI